MDVKEILDKHRTSGVRIDLGCGENKQQGFVGVDVRPVKGVDIVQDLEEYPWVLPDECCELILCSHLVEHINPAKGGFLKFMDECWRILEVGGKMLISAPYAYSKGFVQDPTHVNPVNEVTWAYFDPIEPNAKGLLWRIYKPKPWKIVANTYMEGGNIEVALEKRAWDKSYG